ncbi:MAG TPA: hypothetical protein VLF62_05440 [Candidatus Saccharimonadales bacterium]|nr:hypothetical protein [Candidatus Saccharimonadales bacterium]
MQVEAVRGFEAMQPVAAANQAVMAAEAATPIEVPATVAAAPLTLDGVARSIAAAKEWVATERPADMGNDLLMGLGVTTADQVRAGRMYAAAHGVAA